MEEYFYMFSQGEYSDYCVGGLYKSTQVLTKEWFGEYLKKKLIENHPEHKQFIECLASDIDILQGDSWKESFSTDFIKMAVEECILENVEYEEIWSH